MKRPFFRAQSSPISTIPTTSNKCIHQIQTIPVEIAAIRQATTPIQRAPVLPNLLKIVKRPQSTRQRRQSTQQRPTISPTNDKNNFLNPTNSQFDAAGKQHGASNPNKNIQSPRLPWNRTKPVTAPQNQTTRNLQHARPTRTHHLAPAHNQFNHVDAIVA